MVGGRGRARYMPANTAAAEDDNEDGNGGRKANSVASSSRSSTSSILENLTIKESKEEDRGILEEAMLYEEDYDYDDENKKGSRLKRAKTVGEIFKRQKLKIALVAVSTLVMLIVIASFSSASRSYARAPGRLLSFEDLRNGNYRPELKHISWIDDDGTFPPGQALVNENSQYFTMSWADKKNRTIILQDTLFEYHRKHYRIQQLRLNRQHNKALLSTNHEKNWRHSYFAQYWILDVQSKKIEPVLKNDTNALISLALWSPKGDKLAYVKDRDVYVRHVGGDKDGEIIRVTSDGGDNIFNGIPDWVYEEEVLQGVQGLWWSTEGDHIAFIRINETTVNEFSIPYFVQNSVGKSAYPEVKKIKYPKPGYENPYAEMMLFDVNNSEEPAVVAPTEQDRADDDIITEVLWLGGHKLFVRLTNRESDVSKISIIDAKEKKGTVVRKDDTGGGKNGWFEVMSHTKYVPADKANDRPEDGYVDTINVDGYNHLAYFSPITASKPKKILTKGEWEVVDAPSAVDLARNTVYFIGTKKSPIERHLYSVKLDGSNFTEITDTSTDGYYGASFSKDNRFCLLTYRGPEVPWQMVIDMEKSTAEKLDGEMIADNSELVARMKEHSLPILNYEQIIVDKNNETGKPVLINTVEILPPNFDRTKRYPVLFHCYAGPVSQTVKKTYNIDLQKILPSQNDAIVVIADGRGTGFMGRDFRAVVRDKLGQYEVQDQIAAAKNWASRPYVDKERLAIWGWSYGGFMTLKTLETDAGQTFSYGMAVAPVTDWRLYDSIYTERYMHTPKHNPLGYNNAAINNATALGENTRFLVMHGTGDDNVHFQNTLVLLDKLDQASVENYDVHVFPDSDHSIYYHNANKIVYDKLYHWIINAFNGEFNDLGHKF